MGYSDQQFYTRRWVLRAPAESFGTSTASSTAGHDLSDVCIIPNFKRRTAVSAVRLVCTTIPDAGSTALVAHVMNGTDTFGTVVLTTAAVGSENDVTVTTAANGTYAAAGEMTINLTGTSTASGDANGSYDVFVEECEKYTA